MTPRVSIVTATYRRPLVLRAAMGSVLAQDMPEWEHIVVGDGCADDTEAVVRGFGDPRIRWHNLPANSGGQSAPNNAGVALARAPLVAFLNQDDLWFPDHLSTALAFHAETAAAISVSPMLVLADGSRAEGPPDPRRDVLRAEGWTKDRAWRPEVFYLASCWVASRAAIERVGPWADAAQTRLSPSAEWLWRASRRGVPVALRPRATVLCIHAAARRGTYVARRSPEHERALAWVTAGAETGAALFEIAAMWNGADALAARTARLPGRVNRWLSRRGLHPDAVRRALLRIGKGVWVQRVFARGRAAAALPAGTPVPAGSAAPPGLFAAGWHDAEPDGRWSRDAEAELILGAPGPGFVMEITARSLAPQRVSLSVDGRPAGEAMAGPEPSVFRLPLGSAGPLCVGLVVQHLLRPCDVTGGGDARRLGLFLQSLRLVPAAPGDAAPAPPAQSGSPSPQAESASGGANSGMSSGSSGTGGRP
jgi:glycosyltransferase involved in cell wall biosynthesis